MTELSMDMAQDATAEYRRPDPKTFVSVTYEIDPSEDLSEIVSKLAAFAAVKNLNISTNQESFYF